MEKPARARFVYDSGVTTTLRLGRTFQEIDCLSDMLKRQFDRAGAAFTLPGMCCYRTEAVIQNTGGCAQFFAFISR